MKRYSLLILLFLIPQFSLAQNETGVIYFVFGSDSSTPGINVRDRTAFYSNTGFNLFASPDRNAARLMDPAFRNKYKDSNGEPFRFTHWVQGGSLYRYAENTNIPYPSLMTNYLMNTYYGEAMEQFGDENTYHYHTWVWSDPDGDGRYHWNQTPQYRDAREDFLLTMAELLVEEDVFPVSFRSGWHFMDNDWQSDLNDWLPFSLHNAHPSKKQSDPEPVDNLFDWSQSPSTWVPYQPQDENYQLPGGDSGWNTRSMHFGSVTEAKIRDMFEAASQGIDQVPCIWSHVAEATFISDFERVFSLIEKVAADYPEVEYRYDTAVEAMQRWLKVDDTEAPQLEVLEVANSSGSKIFVKTDEPIFQKYPFVAVKDIYEKHQIMEMQYRGNNEWLSVETFNDNELSKIAGWSVAVSDSAGNQAKYHYDRLPDDIYLDNEGETFSAEGSWQVLDHNQLDLMWGRNSHVSTFNNGEAKAMWTHQIDREAHYDFFIRFPEGQDVSENIDYEIWVNGEVQRTGLITNTASNQWHLLSDVQLVEQDQVEVQISKSAENGEVVQIIADAIKISAYRKPIFVQGQRATADLGQVLKGTAVSFEVSLENKGFETAFITSVKSKRNQIIPQDGINIPIAGNSIKTLQLSMLADQVGLVQDTILVATTDPAHAEIEIALKALVKDYFVLVDNDDELGRYTEKGDWRTSVTQAYGQSSRYAFTNAANSDVEAQYTIEVEKEGWYMLSYLIPSASNSAVRAEYTAYVNDERAFSSIQNQNYESTQWRFIDKVYLTPNDQLMLRVSLPDTDQNGSVLRTDAIQAELIGKQLASIVVDNENLDLYQEEGDWFTSVAVANGANSRYTGSKTALATYQLSGIQPGIQELSILIPETVNATTMAQYSIYQGQRQLAQQVINQNEGSGSWTVVGSFLAETSEDVRVTIQNVESGSANRVLRTDAIRISYAVSDTLLTDIESESLLAGQVRLYPNYPNPFNPLTQISFDLPKAAQVLVEVYSIRGTKVAELIQNRQMPSGTHSIQFDGSGLSSGMYLIKLQANDQVRVHKMTLLK